jgi:hypothetical protein
VFGGTLTLVTHWIGLWIDYDVEQERFTAGKDT